MMFIDDFAFEDFSFIDLEKSRCFATKTKGAA